MSHKFIILSFDIVSVIMYRIPCPLNKYLQLENESANSRNLYDYCFEIVTRAMNWADHFRIMVKLI